MIRVKNHSPHPFRGWVRTTVDKLILAEAYATSDGDVAVVRGRKVGHSLWTVDVRCEGLAPGMEMLLDIDELTPVPFDVPALPSNPIEYFGGVPDVDGGWMTLVGWRPEGAGWSFHFRKTHVSVLLIADLWITWRPDSPGLMTGVAVVTASNPGVSAVEEVLSSDIKFNFGSGVVSMLGRDGDRRIARAGEKFFDGQARAIPVTIVWPQHVKPDEWFSIQAMSAVSGVGVDQLWVDGNPKLPPAFDPVTWMQQRTHPAVEALHSWSPGPAGPAPKTTVTGEQTTEQLFVRGESMHRDGLGCEVIAYLGALKFANRPCHHREADGSPLDPSLHTSRPLIFWSGRPHHGLWNIVDRLGKSRAMSDHEASGWYGPDVEHWLMNGLMAAARLTGCPALQELMRAQATLYMLQQTTRPGWSTSGPYASRAIGYECINAVHLYENLEDRALAEKVKAHFLLRLNTIILPSLVGRTWWPDGFAEQNKVSPWQQALGAYGMHLAARYFAVPAARAIAAAGARMVMNQAFRKAEGVWSTYSTLLLPDGLPDPIADGTFTMFGMPLAVAVVLFEDASDHVANDIWAWMQKSTRTNHWSWFAPSLRTTP